MFYKLGKDDSSYNLKNIEYVKSHSSKVGDFIEREYNRQKNNIELIASENYCSEAILAATGSCFSWKYAEGYPYARTSGNKSRYYGGTEVVDEMEEYCCDLWRKVFNTDYHVNVQSHSGSQANLSAYAALVKPGDTILSLDLENGGHLTHGSKVNFSGKLYNMVFYGRDEKGYIDMNEVRELALKHRPKLIVTGASAYSRIIDFEEFSNIAKEVGAYFMVDMAHIAGLIAGGVHPSPFGYADVITTTSHKTLRGPRGGMIFSKPEFAKKIDSAVFPYSQGGPLVHVIAAKAICAEEALRPEFKEYARNVVKNCKAFANEFIKMGYNVLTGGTDNHVFLLDLSKFHFTGHDLQVRCDENGITVNKNCIPGDKRSPQETSGIRLGTAAMTTCGYDENDFIEVAHKMDEIIKKLEEEKQTNL